MVCRVSERPVAPAIAADDVKALSIPEVSQRLGIPVSRVHQLVRDGHLLAIRRDGAIGIPEDFLVDEAALSVRYLVVDTSNWIGGRSVLISPAAVESIDSPKAEEMVAKLEPLAGPDRPFRLSVRELQAMLAVRKGDLKRARELWGEIAKDSGAPQAAAQRASAMLNFYGPAEAK